MFKRAKRAYTLLEVVSASTLFVFVMTLLAGTVSTVLSSRMSMRTAQDLDDTLSTIIDQVSSNDYLVLVTDVFTPPDVCSGDPTNSGSAARSCVQINGQPVVVSYEITPGPDSASVYGSPSNSADYLVIEATATRPDGSTASRSKTVSAPSPGFMEDRGLLRVSMTGDYDTLDTPLMLLGGPSQDTPVAAALPDGSSTLLLRADVDFCTTAEPCLLTLSDGSDNMPHGLSGSDLQQITIDSSRVTDSNVRVTERAHLVLTIDGTNQTSKRHVQTDAHPSQSSVCLWLSFYDFGAQVTPVCNSSESGRAISVSSYTRPGSSTPSPLPTNTPIKIHADKPDSDTCVSPSGMLTYNGSSWSAPTYPVCSSWTWGQPSRILLPGSSLSMPATLSLSPGETTSGVLQYDSTDNPSALPAGGSGNQAVFSAPRLASTCPLSDGACLPPWLNDKSALSLESSCTATVFCFSGQSAPSVGYVSYGSSFAQSRSASLAVVAPISTETAFRTHIQDNDTGSISVTVTELPAGSLSYCNPGCSTVSSAPFTLPAALSAPAQADVSSYIEWRFTPSGSQRTSVTLSLSDGSNTRTQQVTLVPSAPAGSAVSSLPLSTVSKQGTSVVLYSMVQDIDGNDATTWSQDVTNTPSGASESVLSSPTGWSANGLDPTSAASGSYSLSWSLSGDTSSLVLVQAPHTVSNDLTPLSLSQDSSIVPTGSVTVEDIHGDPVSGYPVFFKVLRRGESYVGAYMEPPVCLTDLNGSCTAPDLNVSYGADSGSGKIVAHTPEAQDEVSFTVTPKPRSVSSGQVEITHGSSALVSLTVLDGNNESMPDASVSVVQGATPGLSFLSPTGTTDATGVLSLDIAALASRGTQRVEVVLNGSVTAFFSVTVLPAPAQVSLSSGSLALSLGQDTPSAVTATVRDEDGVPVAGATVTVSCASATVLPSTPVPSGADGTAEILFALSRTAAPGSVSCSIYSGSSTPVSVSVDVS